MKICVTGGAGFIGSHLVENLIGLGHDVLVIDNFSTGRMLNLEGINGCEVIEASLQDIENWQLILKDVKYVFHLAALADIVPSITHPQDYFDANVTGTLNLLQGCIQAGVKRIIYTASSSCYGIPDKFPTPETAKINSQYPYALTKNLGEQLIEHWANVYDLEFSSLRLFNIYGPKSRTSGTYGAVFGVFLAQKLAAKPFTIVGDGTQSRDFTFVSDVVDALTEVAFNAPSNQIYNVGSGKSVSINRIVELLGGDKVHIPKRPGEPDVTFADTSKIENDLNWKAKVSIEDGIKILLENIDYWREAPVWTPKSIDDATKTWFKYLK